MVRDAATGKYRRTRLFVMTLGYSRKSVRLIVPRSKEKPALRELPIEPFRYYRYCERSVNLDGCVEVEAAYYSAQS